MRVYSRSNFRIAILGLAITAAFVSYQLIVNLQSPFSPNPALMLAFVVLCPPSVLSIPFIDLEIGTSSFYFLWAFIALLNAALYATARTMIVGRLKKSD